MSSASFDTSKKEETYNDSLHRCAACVGFFDRFYELFLASSEEVREKFQNTDFGRQKQALRASLYIMPLLHSWSEGYSIHFEKIARRHSRADRDIRPELYDLWLNCLLRAVRETDPLYRTEVGVAWREVLEPGIEFMKSRY